MTDPSSRMLRLLSLLQTHRFWPGEELARRLEVSPRTLRRDVDRLRELGYPVDATRGTGGGYRLQAGADLPPLLLEDDEAVAIAVGLRTAAGAAVEGIEETSVRALAKLEQVLPARLRRRVGALQASTVTLTWTSPQHVVDPEALATIAQACRDDARLQFEYRPREGEPATRAVEPHRLVSVGRRWYLVAWDVHRADWRTFRVDRLSAPRTSGARFVPRTPPDGDAAAYVRRSLQSIPTRFEADVTVHRAADEVGPRVRPFGGRVEPSGEGVCRLRMAGDSLAWLAAGVALLECDFEVHGPPELVDWLRGLGARIARGAGPAPG